MINRLYPFKSPLNVKRNKRSFQIDKVWENTPSTNPSCTGYMKMSTKWPQIKSSTLEGIWEDGNVNVFLLLGFLNSSPNTSYFSPTGQTAWMSQTSGMLRALQRVSPGLPLPGQMKWLGPGERAGVLGWG